MELCEKILLLKSIDGLGKKALSSININELKDVDENSIWYYIDNLKINNRRIKPPEKIEQKQELVQTVKYKIKKTRDLGISIITKNDSNYPEKMLRLNYPPAILFAQGNIKNLAKRGVAVIGSRTPSKLGMLVAKRFGEFLSERGFSVISGLANGCDAAAHEGALSKSGITIAVMPSPLDNIYPKTNIDLYKKIISSDGCTISEYAIGEKIHKSNFIERDLLQCALSDGIIVAEAGEKSGTMHAVNGGVSLNMPIGCFDFTDNHYMNFKQSSGNKMLITSNKAISLCETKSIEEFLKKCTKNQQKQLSLFF